MAIKLSRFPPDSTSGKVYRWFRIGFLVAIAACVLFFAVTYGTWRVPADCKGMGPAFNPGQSVIIHKRLRKATQLQRGDIVVFGVVDPATASQSRLLSRVVGMPGETVEVVQGLVQINGQSIDDTWNSSDPLVSLENINIKPLTVGPASLYLLNDDRLSDTPDTRILGVIPEKAVAGKVIMNLSF